MKLPMRILKSEAGQVLPMALVLLALGGLLVVPVLSLMSTNLVANRVVETNNYELYAADAGVEHALWNMQYNSDGFTLPNDGAPPTQLPEFTLNERTVDVQISKSVGEPYKITSIATGANGHSTTVECYIDIEADLSWFFDSAITAGDDVVIKPGTEVVGDVTYGDTITYKDRDQIDGELIKDPDLVTNWPSAEYLSSYYLAQVTTAPDINAGTTISVDGYTAISPRSIWNGGPAHALGNLTITGSGWARLDGTLYVAGVLTVQPGCTIDLNGHTIFVAYPYPNPYTVGTVAIEIKPGSSIVGSGCIIAVGDIIFKPNLSAGDKLIGVAEDITPITTPAPKDYFLLSKFTADITGTVDLFRVNCKDSGQVKVAIYEDVAGVPGNLKLAVDTSKAVVETSTDVIAGWNDIIFPETDVQAGTAYWLAANSNAAIIRIYNGTGTGVRLSKAAPYSGFTTFPDPAGSGFTQVTNTTYLFAGYNTPFVFVMSIDGTSTLYPGGTLYGAIAGNADVELKPGCTLTLTAVPDDGLDFPGMDTGEDEIPGTPATIRTYTIK
ncbi:MAG: hypothetical protein MUO89_07210 [Dehalococcoidia bacterium]|nr:hypothetical protein [Dehalococcoidia bacterium]